MCRGLSFVGMSGEEWLSRFAGLLAILDVSIGEGMRVMDRMTGEGRVRWGGVALFVE